MFNRNTELERQRERFDLEPKPAEGSRYRFPFPMFPEKVISFLINGPQTTEWFCEHFSDEPRHAVVLGLLRMRNNGDIRYDIARDEFRLPPTRHLLADIAKSPTTEELYAAPKQSGYRADQFDSAFNG